MYGMRKWPRKINESFSILIIHRFHVLCGCIEHRKCFYLNSYIMANKVLSKCMYCLLLRKYFLHHSQYGLLLLVQLCTFRHQIHLIPK